MLYLQGYDLRTLPKSHYSTLEIGRHSTALDIRRSFKRLSKVYHPDKHGLGDDSQFQAVKESYDVSRSCIGTTRAAVVLIAPY
jgi:preprotein translocase subunit Sec63